MSNEKNISALNNLIEINNDRVEGYETASKETESADLKSLFAALSGTSTSILSELRSEVSKLGGTPEEGTRVTGKFFRAWMDVKAALTGNNRHEILASCEFGEDKAQEAYEDALATDAELPTNVRQLITDQKASLLESHNLIKKYRDMHQAINS